MKQSVESKSLAAVEKNRHSTQIHTVQRTYEDIFVERRATGGTAHLEGSRWTRAGGRGMGFTATANGDCNEDDVDQSDRSTKPSTPQLQLEAGNGL